MKVSKLSPDKIDISEKYVLLISLDNKQSQDSDWKKTNKI